MYMTTRIKAFEVGPNKHLVCNAITGEIVVMSDAGIRLLDALRRGDVHSCGSGVLEELERKRFLFASQEEEEGIFLEVCRSSWNDFRLNAPRHYTFIVNTHCNFRCPYCFEEVFNAPPKTLTQEQIDAAFRIIDRYAAKQAQDKAPDFEIFGGEPLLPDSRPVLGYLMSQIAERGGQASVQTNGFFLLSYIDFLDAHQEHISQVQVTLDGPKEVHDRRRIPKGGQPTFDRIVSGIDALVKQELPIRINVRMNVDRDNVDYLETMAEIFEANGWAGNSQFTFIAAPVDNRCGTIRNVEALLGWHELFERVFPLSADSGRGPYDLSVFKIASYFRYYLDTVRKSCPVQPRFTPKVLYCEAAAFKLFAFHPDGRIYPCPETVGKEPLAVGTYYPRFALDRSRARQWRRQTILNKERCRSCEISTFCGGGCILAALMQNGTMTEPVCDDAKALLEFYFGEIRRASQ